MSEPSPTWTTAHCVVAAADLAAEQAKARKLWWALCSTIETANRLLGYCEGANVPYPGAPGACLQLEAAQRLLLSIDVYDEESERV